MLKLQYCHRWDHDPAAALEWLETMQCLDAFGVTEAIKDLFPVPFVIWAWSSWSQFPRPKKSAVGCFVPLEEFFWVLHSSTVPQSLTYQTVSTGPRQLRRQKFEPNLISYNTVTWFYHCMGNSGRKLCMKLQEVPSNHRSSTDISWNSVDIRVSMGDRISIHWGGRCICTSRGSRQRGGSLGTSLARCFGG